MRVVKAPTELRSFGGKLAVTIGMFDGVHLGHQRIIQSALEATRRHGGAALVITFDRHPDAVLAPAHAPPLIQPLWHRLRALEALGVEFLWLITFDTEFSSQAPDTFVRRLVADTGGIQSFWVGADFAFGRGRTGNAAVLTQLGAALGFDVHCIEPVQVEGEPVSSTRIRTAIQAGAFGRAARLLGRPYALAGTVVRGGGLGRMLGFPTANLDVSGLVLPPRGVYAARARLGAAQYRAAVCIGLRPTLHPGASTLTVEAHLLGAAGQFYGAELELEFVAKLRDEVAFPDTDALKQQINADIAVVRGLLGA